MFADILGLPVETVDVNETGTLGCAIAAAAATGTYPSLREAARAMSPNARRVEPDMAAHAAYEKRYRLYLRLIGCLSPVWDEMRACADGSAQRL